MAGTKGVKVMTLKMSEWYKELEETGSLDIDMEDGGPLFRLKPPELWPRGVRKQINENPQDFELQARLLLGDEYDRWIEAGWTDEAFNAALIKRHELTAPES